MAVDREIERIDVYVESREKENEPLGERVKARERERAREKMREKIDEYKHLFDKRFNSPIVSSAIFM